MWGRHHHHQQLHKGPDCSFSWAWMGETAFVLRRSTVVFGAKPHYYCPGNHEPFSKTTMSRCTQLFNVGFRVAPLKRHKLAVCIYKSEFLGWISNKTKIFSLLGFLGMPWWEECLFMSFLRQAVYAFHGPVPSASLSHLLPWFILIL